MADTDEGNWGGLGPRGVELMEEDVGAKPPRLQEGPKAWCRQLRAALSAHVGAWIMACIWSYSSTALPSLREDADFGVNGLENHTTIITGSQEAWIASITFLAGAVGGPVLGPVADVTGLRASLLIVTGPMLAGWLLVAFAPNIALILVGRFVTGFFVSGVGVSNVLIAEFSHEERRGRLNFIFDMMFCVGVLFIYIVGTYTPWRVQAGLCAGVCALFIALLFTIPESPKCLLRKGRTEAAKQALRWVRDRYDVQQEFRDITDTVEEEQRLARAEHALAANVFTRLASACTRMAVLKPIFLCICLQFFLQVCGVVPIVCYAVDVFREAGNVQIHENVSTIIFGAINLLATIAAYFFVDKFGRRKLFIGSELGLTFSLIAIGTFLYGKNVLGHADHLDNFSWTLLLFFIVFIVAYSFGVGPMPWVIMGEIVEPGVKGASSGVIIFATRVFGFFVMFYFKDTMAALGQHGVYWGFACVCFAGAVFTYFFLPETKGRTLEQIQRDLRRGWCVIGRAAN